MINVSTLIILLLLFQPVIADQNQKIAQSAKKQAGVSVKKTAGTGQSQQPSFYKPPSPETRFSQKPSFDMLIPVDLQLRSLRNGNIEEAYNLTSHGFKENTSLQAFEEFVKENPILTDHIEILITSQTQNTETGEGEVLVVLDPDKKNARVDFTLIKQDDAWKIWNVEVLTSYSGEIRHLINTPTTILVPIKEQLNAIKEDNIIKAYSYYSEEFKKKVSLEQFQKLIDRQPILMKYQKMTYETPVIKEGVGYVEVQLADDSNETTFEYTLNIEEDAWKIWNFHVLKRTPLSQNIEESLSPVNEGEGPSVPLNEPVESRVQFEKFQIGDSADSVGHVLDPVEVFEAPPKGDLYINLYIRNGKIGDQISITLEHVDSRSKLPLVSTNLSQSGDAILNIAFARPTAGWLEGRYSLAVHSASGVNKLFSFKIK